MNIALFEPSQRRNHQVRLTGRQARHIIEVLKLSEGESLSVGEINGLIGRGQIERLTQAGDNSEVELNVELNSTPPAPSPLVLVIALPRPQMLKRILQTAACMGVKTLAFTHSEKVEKSFWQSPQLKPDMIRENILLGLEQAKDTGWPRLLFLKRYHELLEFIDQQTQECILLHPGNFQHFHSLDRQQAQTVLLGPEGGWTEKEANALIKKGCTPYQMGSRILRVETAVTSILSHFL